MPASTALLADKYGILGPVIRKTQTAAAADVTASSKIDLQTPIDQYLKSLVQAGDTVDSFEPLSDDVYTKEVNISSSITLFSRYSQIQPGSKNDQFIDKLHRLRNVMPIQIFSRLDSMSFIHWINIIWVKSQKGVPDVNTTFLNPKVI